MCKVYEAEELSRMATRLEKICAEKGMNDPVQKAELARSLFESLDDAAALQLTKLTNPFR
jgi:hypothetical protein